MDVVGVLTIKQHLRIKAFFGTSENREAKEFCHSWDRADVNGTLQGVDRLATLERPIDLVAKFRQRVVITQIDRAQQFAE